MSEAPKPMRRHTLTIDGRERLTAQGIQRVDAFSEELITARTELGALHIKGEGLHIENLSSDTGELSVTGKVVALSYTQSAPGGSLLKRLFR